MSLPSLMLLIGLRHIPILSFLKVKAVPCFVNDDSIAKKKEGLKYLTLST